MNAILSQGRIYEPSDGGMARSYLLKLREQLSMIRVAQLMTIEGFRQP